MTFRSSSADPASPAGGPDARPPGLGAQLGRTRGALFDLIGAHIRLAQAEFSEIGDQLKRAAMLGAVALVLLLIAGLTLVVGLILWLDEWAFGSIGWGVLHGPLLLIGLAVLVLLAIVDLGWRRAAASLVVATALAVAVALVVGLDWRHVGDTTFSGWSLPARPASLAIIWGGLVLAVMGGLLGGFLGRARGTILGVIAGAILGGLFGLLGAAHPGPKIGVAVGLAVGLLVLPLWAAVLFFRHGVDWDKLKARFWPTQTIETTKETIEWVREQMPLGRKS